MSTLQEEHSSIDTRIVCELIEIIPPDWEQAILEVDYFNDGEIEEYSHVIKNPVKSISNITPSNQIYDDIRELSLTFKKYEYQWKKVVYTINLDSDNNWEYKVNFEY
jgi:hypothetical protein